MTYYFCVLSHPCSHPPRGHGGRTHGRDPRKQRNTSHHGAATLCFFRRPVALMSHHYMQCRSTASRVKPGRPTKSVTSDEKTRRGTHALGPWRDPRPPRPGRPLTRRSIPGACVADRRKTSTDQASRKMPPSLPVSRHVSLAACHKLIKETSHGSALTRPFEPSPHHTPFDTATMCVSMQQGPQQDSTSDPPPPRSSQRCLDGVGQK